MPGTPADSLAAQVCLIKPLTSSNISKNPIHLVLARASEFA